LVLDEEIKLKNEELHSMEEKLREREEFLKQKEMELRRLEEKNKDPESSLELDLDIKIQEPVNVPYRRNIEIRGLEKINICSNDPIEIDIEPHEVTKVKIGIPRINDLFYGGLLVNSSCVVMGNNITGEELFLRLFIADGLKEGLPCIYISTTEKIDVIREKFRPLIPDINVYEKKGLMKYIDAYSIDNEKSSDNGSIYYIKDQKDTGEIIHTLAKVLNDIKNQFNNSPSIKLAFNNLTPMIINKDLSSAFLFLSDFNKKCHGASDYNVTAMFALNNSPFEDKDDLKEVIFSQMDNGFVLKKENDKLYFKVEGIADVEFRGYIEYYLHQNNIKLVCFINEHIR
jgi:archaellum biogenesis ATPase FlaH